jgi:hypothetical protein
MCRVHDLALGDELEAKEAFHGKNRAERRKEVEHGWCRVALREALDMHDMERLRGAIMRAKEAGISDEDSYVTTALADLRREETRVCKAGTQRQSIGEEVCCRHALERFLSLIAPRWSRLLESFVGGIGVQAPARNLQGERTIGAAPCIEPVKLWTEDTRGMGMDNQFDVDNAIKPFLDSERACSIATTVTNQSLEFRFRWCIDADLNVPTIGLTGLIILVNGDGKFLSESWGTLGSEGTDMDGRASLSVCPGDLPDEVFACFICSVNRARHEGGVAGVCVVDDLRVLLAPSSNSPPFWRHYFCKDAPSQHANVWGSALLFRGPHKSWCLEPLAYTSCIKAFVADASYSAAAVSTAAKSIAWELRWLVKDRCWNTACVERGLHPHKEDGWIAPIQVKV